MRRHRLLLAALVLLPLALLLRAYVPVILGNPTSSLGATWPAGSTLSYSFNSQIGPTMPNLEPGSTPLQAIDAAFQAATAAAGLAAANLGSVPVTDAGMDGIDLVSFANTPANQALLMGALATTVTYLYVSPPNATLVGFDIIVSGTAPVSTLGSGGFFDIQSLVAHEASHALGMDHSPILSSTLFHNYFTGSVRGRTLAPDDLAGLATHYTMIPPLTGGVTGVVQLPSATPVAGAHAFLVDAITGRVEAGALSMPNGIFSIAGVRWGIYHLYVEPLDGPMTPTDLLGGYWATVPVNTAFNSTVLGGLANPTVLAVRPGQTTSTGPVIVGSMTPIRNISQVFFNSNPTPPGSASTLEQAAPYTGYLGIFGTGVHLVPDAGFSVASPFVQITGASTWSGVNPTFSDRIFPLAIPAGSPPGAYVLRMWDNATGNLVAFPGCLEVVPGPTPEAWAVSYGQPGSGSVGPVTLVANGSPTIGNSAFSLTASGLVPGETAFVVVSTAPDWVPLAPGFTVAVDLASSLFPITALPIPVTAGSMTIAIPIPNLAGLAGIQLYLQLAVTDAASTYGLTVTDAVALHIG